MKELWDPCHQWYFAAVQSFNGGFQALSTLDRLCFQHSEGEADHFLGGGRGKRREQRTTFEHCNFTPKPPTAASSTPTSCKGDNGQTPETSLGRLQPQMDSCPLARCHLCNSPPWAVCPAISSSSKPLFLSVEL